MLSCPGVRLSPSSPPLILCCALLISNVQQEMNEMSFFTPEILEARRMGSVANPAADMRDMIGHAVNARRQMGQSEAVHQVARELRIKPRRVLAILRGEIGRVWADEFAAAQHWYARECERQAEQNRQQAELLAARAAALRESLCVSSG